MATEALIVMDSYWVHVALKIKDRSNYMWHTTLYVKVNKYINQNYRQEKSCSGLGLGLEKSCSIHISKNSQLMGGVHSQQKYNFYPHKLLPRASRL